MDARVRAWMTPDPLTVCEDDAALAALDQMTDRGVRHLPVLDAAGRLIGIVSLDDLRATFPVDVSLRRVIGPAERRRFLDYGVTDAMTWMPQTVDPNATLEEAAHALTEHRIGCLPVVDDDTKLVGILSEADVMRGLVAVRKEERVIASGPSAAKGLVDQLWGERRRLVDQLESWQNTERLLSADIREEPRDSADRASDESDLARLEPISARASRRLRAIEGAIARAERGRFGICEHCGEPISVNRLRTIPETNLCVACARAAWSERGAT